MFGMESYPERIWNKNINHSKYWWLLPLCSVRSFLQNFHLIPIRFTGSIRAKITQIRLQVARFALYTVYLHL